MTREESATNCPTTYTSKNPGSGDGSASSHSIPSLPSTSWEHPSFQGNRIFNYQCTRQAKSAVKPSVIPAKPSVIQNLPSFPQNLPSFPQNLPSFPQNLPSFPQNLPSFPRRNVTPAKAGAGIHTASHKQIYPFQRLWIPVSTGMTPALVKTGD